MNLVVKKVIRYECVKSVSEIISYSLTIKLKKIKKIQDCEIPSNSLSDLHDLNRLFGEENKSLK